LFIKKERDEAVEYDDERPPILKEKEIPGIKVVGNKNRREEVEEAEAPAY
jgi:hypothetical protein